jgi:hypothetical protein
MYGNIYRPTSAAILDNRKFFNKDDSLYDNPPNIITYNEDSLMKKVGYSYGQPPSVMNDEDAFRLNEFGIALKNISKVEKKIPNIAIVPTENDDSEDSGDSGSGSKGVKASDKADESINKDKSSSSDSVKESKGSKGSKGDETKESFLDSNHVHCEAGENGKNICGGTNLYPILDPRFNLREAAKNMVLLEDHLFHEGKRCQDCILKHCLIIEGFLEEGITLDKKRQYTDILTKSLKEFRGIFRDISIKITKGNLTDSDCATFAQRIRLIRKPLCQQFATFIQ